MLLYPLACGWACGWAPQGLEEEPSVWPEL